MERYKLGFFCGVGDGGSRPKGGGSNSFQLHTLIESDETIGSVAFPRHYTCLLISLARLDSSQNEDASLYIMDDSQDVALIHQCQEEHSVIYFLANLPMLFTDLQLGFNKMKRTDSIDSNSSSGPSDLTGRPLNKNPKAP